MNDRTSYYYVPALVLCTVLGNLMPAASQALPSYPAQFNSNYPNSTTGNASCLACHGTSSSGNANTSAFNRYGTDLRNASGNTLAQRLQSIEQFDSDGEGNNNRAEIDANAQPGWCDTSRAGCNNGGFTPPSSITLRDPAPTNQAPTADPGGPYSATVGSPVTFNGGGSRDPDGSIGSYAWDFGDGSLGTGVSPSIAYTSAGNFIVTLTVTDNQGVRSTPASTTVTVNVGLQPPVADAGGPYTGSIGVPVNFDGTGSTDPDGSVVSHDWDFGDGSTGNGSAPMHSYAAGGSFTVTLTVTDNDNLTSTATTTAGIADGSGSQPPIARVGGPYVGTAGAAISFDGSGSSDPDGSIAGYAWDFGDGGTGNGAQPAHVYAAASRYTVTLTVTDDSGTTGSASTTADVTDVNRLPVANPGGPYYGQPGAAVSFDGRGSSDPDGSVVAYAWNFGDGETGSGATPTHTYAATGQYSASLVVTDNAGATSTVATAQVAIKDPQTPTSPTGGEALYTANCEVCHGKPWGGPAADPALSGMKRVAGARACTIEGAIFGTSVFPNGVPAMVSFGNPGLTPAEIGQLADYLNGQPASGEQRYITACAGCHGNEGRGGRVDEGVLGDDAGGIREAIHDEREMMFLSCLPASDLELLAGFLGGSGNGQCGDDCDEEDENNHDRSHCQMSDDCDGDGRKDESDDDDDNDRMPDQYEESNGFNPYDPADADEDADRDGKSNVAEFLAGTDPLQAASKSNSSSGGGGGVGTLSLLGLLLLTWARHLQRAAAVVRSRGRNHVQ